jgi:hypothetical protein
MGNRLLTLEVAYDKQTQVHESPGAILHARCFAAVERASSDAIGDTFAEADIGEVVDG